MTILSGCAPTSAKIVTVNNFCSGAYYSITEKKLEKSDFDNMARIRKNKKFRVTIDKLIDYITINEKEFKVCLENK